MRKLIVFLILFLSGCARLITDVAIFDSHCMIDQAALESNLNQVVGTISTHQTRNQYETAISKLEKEVNKLVDDLVAEHYVAATDKDKTKTILKQEYPAALRRAKEKHLQAVQDFLEAKSLADPNRRLIKFLEAQTNALQGDSIIHEVEDDVEKQLSLYQKKEPSSSPKVLESIAAVRESSKSESPAVGYSKLIQDPIAAHVVNADKKCWEGIYNETWGSGSWGNTDIAIKMESAVEYTLKGLRLDSAKVTQAVFKTLGQAIQLTAAAYGVPLPSKSASTQEGITIDDDVIQADQRKLDADSSRRVSRRSVLAMMEVIVSQDEALKHASKYRDAVEHIKKSFETYKATLLIPE